MVLRLTARYLILQSLYFLRQRKPSRVAPYKIIATCGPTVGKVLTLGLRSH